jgi:hypothetical protein
MSASVSGHPGVHFSETRVFNAIVLNGLEDEVRFGFGRIVIGGQGEDFPHAQ